WPRAATAREREYRDRGARRYARAEAPCPAPHDGRDTSGPRLAAPPSPFRGAGERAIGAARDSLGTPRRNDRRVCRELPCPYVILSRVDGEGSPDTRRMVA